MVPRTTVLGAILLPGYLGGAVATNLRFDPSMAPLEHYLMADRHAEIALAKSLAPTSTSRHATVLIF
jgi:hypothetical protein